MQERRLVRARTLAEFREALVSLATAGGGPAIRRRAVLVPARAAGELLRRGIERRLATGATLLPDFLTRDDLYDALAQALGVRRLASVERDVLFGRAARKATRRAAVGVAPFAVRPGLVSAMREFYDELARRERPVRRFARALFDELRAERGTDRGSESLIAQTAFLGFTFLAYERLATAAAGAGDEHAIRRRVVAEQPALPLDHLVVAVADHPADPRGLWPADFGALGRLRGLRVIDVVVTDGLHDAGFRARMERELPGLVEVRAARVDGAPLFISPAAPAPGVRPGSQADEDLVHLSRDREDELRDVVRVIRQRAAGSGHRIAGGVAIAFHRPLPYLALARQVFADAAVPYAAFDAQPLAGEPYAAAVDLLLAFARTRGTRDAAVALLRCQAFAWMDRDGPVTGGDVAALNLALTERRATGDATTFAAEVARWAAAGRHRDEPAARALRAAQLAAAVEAELRAYATGPAASLQLEALAAVLRRHERSGDHDEADARRGQRARIAVLSVLETLAAAYRRHDDGPRPEAELSAAVRHAIESRTFTPERGQAGVLLVDSVAARFVDVDHLHVVGLVETDWPERPRRNIFYTRGLLGSLGWPNDADERGAEQAAFLDLVQSARRTTWLHAFELEGEAVVARSPLVELVRALPSRPDDAGPRPRVFADEVWTAEGEPAVPADTAVARWLDLRRLRPELSDPRYGGQVRAQPPQAYRVSRVDRYVDCPFKYFAESVLGLAEERDEEAGLSPLVRGTLVHELFERFYKEWQAGGHGAITAATLPEAVAAFRAIADARLAQLPPADRALEETRLLGSIVGRGVAERVFELEVDAGMDVRERLIEADLRGVFAFPYNAGLESRDIAISGKADRVDVLEDGGLRVVDYKLGRPPDKRRSIQIAVYAVAAQQLLARTRGGTFPIRTALYLAFGEDKQFAQAVGSGGPVASDIASRAAEFSAKVEEIERGAFPAQPARLSDCRWCGYAGVCRKEYRRAEPDDAATDAV
jgi:RecB family exonuclease